MVRNNSHCHSHGQHALTLASLGWSETIRLVYRVARGQPAPQGSAVGTGTQAVRGITPTAARWCTPGGFRLHYHGTEGGGAASEPMCAANCQDQQRKPDRNVEHRTRGIAWNQCPSKTIIICRSHSQACQNLCGSPLWGALLRPAALERGVLISRCSQA